MTRAVSLLAAFILLLPTTHGHITEDSKTSNETNVNGTSNLVHNIRRQLMVDNYDYMSTETEEPFPMKHELDNADTTIEPETLPTPPDYDTTTDLLGSHVNDIFIPRTRDLPEDDGILDARAKVQSEDLSDTDTLSEEHEVDKNDLLYYIDDKRLKTEKDAIDNDSEENEQSSEATSPKVKYKVLKMKQPEWPGEGRRAGAAAPTYRRFLQEEGGEGVAIINLDNEPFPEFRLPSARRQYMSAEDPTELEIAPLSEFSEEMRLRVSVHSSPSACSYSGSDNINVKSINDIKEDLRRNNDDYRDKTLRGNKRLADSFDINDVQQVPNRRIFEIVSDGKMFNDTAATKKSKRFKVTANSLNSNADMKLASDSSVTDQGLVEKRLRFMEKYKGLMNNFMESKKAESPTEPMPTLQEEKEEGEYDAEGEGKTQLKGYKRAQAEEQSHEAHTPSAFELDMAPARGGRVHGLRMKNRLCYRNVMIPEGPKYDSKGNVYLKEHGTRGGNYTHTKPPRILLPRCCNCCKKSVLGCQ